MGDSGALLLGLLLATSTISLTGQIDSTALTARGGGLVPAYLPIVVPLMVLAIPFLDLVMGYVRGHGEGRGSSLRTSNTFITAYCNEATLTCGLSC